MTFDRQAPLDTQNEPARVSDLDARRWTPERVASMVAARYPTANPCPNWCQEGHGHPYQIAPGETGDRARSRTHYGQLADLLEFGLRVPIVADEYSDETGKITDPGHHSAAIVEAPYPYSQKSENLTPNNLRDIARELIRAAHQLDQVTTQAGPARSTIT